MRRVFLTGIILTTASCSGSDARAPWLTETATCARLAGAYDVTFTLLSGDCGAFAPEIIDYAQASTQQQLQQCTTNTSKSADGCTADIDATCPAADGGSTREVGTVHGSYDGASATATEQITIFDPSGAVRCSGSYTLTYTKR